MLETNLDLLLEVGKLGQHHDFSIKISFPEAFTLDMFHGKALDGFTDLYMRYVCSKLYDRAEYYDLERVLRFEGDNWSAQIECQIARVYTSLIPREGPVKPIPRMHMTHSGGQDSFHLEFGYLMGEALMNAVRHGNGWDPRKHAFIRSYLGEHGLIFTIEDEGEGFDVEHIARLINSDRYGDEYPEGGYGTRQFRDGRMWHESTEPKRCKTPRIGYNPNGNVWLMIYSFTDCRYYPVTFNKRMRDFGGLVLPTNLELCRNNKTRNKRKNLPKQRK